MKRLKSIISFIALATFSLGVAVACSGGIKSMTITNKETLTSEWHVDDEARTLSFTSDPTIDAQAELKAGNLSLKLSDATVFTVSDLSLTPIKAGTSKVELVYKGTSYDYVNITVEPKVSLFISNKDALTEDWNVGDDSRTLTYTSDPAIDASKVSLKVGDSTIVSANGLVLTPLKEGKTTVELIYGNKSYDSVDITINPKFIDYVHDSNVHLQLDYEGKDFFTDGVGEMKLLRHIDGDTDHFTPVFTKKTGDKTVKSRYYAIDTPESTGRIQEWGVKASNFTKERITNANEHGTIVVTYTNLHEYVIPQHDSTGERYVSLVWINETKPHAPKEELVLLNLWIVQEGFSYLKGVDDIPEYQDTFFAAQKQAEKFKLNMWSGPDPDFNRGDFKDTSLLELKAEVVASIKDPTHVNIFDGQKVRVTGNVSAFTNNMLYLEDEYEVEVDGKLVTEYAAINIFCGMKAPSSLYTRPNTRISVPAFAVDSENFGFQLSGVEGKFPSDPTDPDIKSDQVKLIAYPQDNVEKGLKTFEYTSEQLSALASASNDTPNKFESLYCAVKLTTPMTASSFYINEKGDEITIRFKNLSFSLYITNINWLKLDPSRPTYVFKTEEDWIGRSFILDSGIYTWHKTSSGKINYQVILSSATSLRWIHE